MMTLLSASGDGIDDDFVVSASGDGIDDDFVVCQWRRN